jgi:hypothetical protein
MGGKGKSGRTGRFVAGQQKQRLIQKPKSGDRRRGIEAAAENLKATVEQTEARARVKRLDMILGRQEVAGKDAVAAAAVRKDAAAVARSGDFLRAGDLLQEELQRRQ